MSSVFTDAKRSNFSHRFLSFFSHRLSRTESLFYYNSGEMKCLPKTRSSYCRCMISRDGKTDADCNIQFKPPKFQAKIQSGYTKILFPGIKT